MVDEVQTNKEFDMSKVKALVTEDTHTVEQKYMAPYQIDSFANFIFLSNSDHMMKIEAGERRFLVLEVSGRYAGAETDESKQYFEKLLALSTGGRASSIAHFLYTRDLSNFRPRSLPETRATMQQKVLSLNDVQRWWLLNDAALCWRTRAGRIMGPSSKKCTWFRSNRTVTMCSTSHPRYCESARRCFFQGCITRAPVCLGCLRMPCPMPRYFLRPQRQLLLSTA